MNAQQLEAYLHEKIPLSQAMEVRAVAVEEGLVLAAPLAPNINHRGSMFGGSLDALGLLTGWGALRLRLDDGARIVVARQCTRYLAPATGEVVARCEIPDGPALKAFLDAYRRRGRAKLALEVNLFQGDVRVAHLEAEFAALTSSGHASTGDASMGDAS